MSEKQVGSKSNKTFMILSAFGIVMLLDAHTWTTVNIFANIIEYNSFFMPLFVFISGYFFSEGSLENMPGLVMKKNKEIHDAVFILGILLSWAGAFDGSSGNNTV
ncbi:hypothetical protein [Roseburia hominis]|uniref:hypothetical protein n=1 Tax=Roseburia hominis TaxID=301301 RepID=UPI002365173F|nr:hypothetical protein [Roseburia hominis]